MRHCCSYPSSSNEIFPCIYRCNSCGSTWTHGSDEAGEYAGNVYPMILDETEAHKQLVRSIEKMLEMRNAESKTSI